MTNRLGIVPAHLYRTISLLGTMVVVSTLIAGCVAGCGGTSKLDQARRGEVLLPGDKPLEHSVHSTELRVAMQTLEQVTLEKLPEDLDGARSRPSRRDEVMRLADQLAHAAAALPGMLGTFELPDDAAPRFRELADQLRHEALALRGRAAAGDLRTGRDETERILATCNACHAEMRTRSGVGPAPAT